MTATPDTAFWMDASFWFGAVGAAVAVGGILFPFVRERRHREESAARAAGQIAYDFHSLIIDRLRIRFTPELIDVEGLMLRELRASAALEMLKDIRFSDLSTEAQEPFIRFRASAQALHQAMNIEHPKRDVPLSDYLRVYRLMQGAYGTLQTALMRRAKVSRPPLSWSPPETWKVLNWARRRKERSRQDKRERRRKLR